MAQICSDIINTKDGEHDKRKNFIGGEAPNVFISASKNLPLKNELQKFFKNKANKTRLQQFIKSQFKEQLINTEKRFFYSTRSECCEITKGGETRTPDFECTRVEADVIMFFIYSQIRKSSSDTTVVIDAEDTDVIVASSYVSNILPGTLGIKRKKAIFDAKCLTTPEMSKVIIRFHVMTGCDSISSFFGKGKKAVWKRVDGCIEAINHLQKATPDSLEKFVIKFIYNDKKSNTLKEMRKNIWRKTKLKNKKTLARIGPEKSSNDLRTTRVLYQIKNLESFANPSETGTPLDNGYTIINGVCRPKTSHEPALPTKLRMSVEEGNKKESKVVEEKEEQESSDEEEDDYFDEENESESGMTILMLKIKIYKFNL